MKFNHQERLVLNGLLPALIPQQSNRFIYALIDGLARELSFSPEEVEHLELKAGGQKYTDEKGEERVVPEGSVVWNPTRTLEKDIDVPTVVRAILMQNLKEMDERGNLPREAIPVFDKFIKESEWFKEKETGEYHGTDNKEVPEGDIR